MWPATISAKILGTYCIKPNQPGLGDHVCNCGHVVARLAQGRGIAASMCEHSQRIASELGFHAMQFNFVVATHERAIQLWEGLGFAVVGGLPGVFRRKNGVRHPFSRTKMQPDPVLLNS